MDIASMTTLIYNIPDFKNWKNLEWPHHNKRENFPRKKSQFFPKKNFSLLTCKNFFSQNHYYTLIMKVNDKVICIRSNSKNAKANGQIPIYKYQIYTVENIVLFNIINGYPNTIKLKDVDSYYSTELFRTLKEYRRNKLKKLSQKNNWFSPKKKNSIFTCKNFFWGKLENTLKPGCPGRKMLKFIVLETVAHIYLSTYVYTRMLAKPIPEASSMMFHNSKWKNNYYYVQWIMVFLTQRKFMLNTNRTYYNKYISPWDLRKI